MSVPSEINRIKENITAAYNAVSAKGGTIPSSKVSANLASAIQSITVGTGVTVYGAIVADYPSGATCTCAKGTTTYTAGNTGGNWGFTVPSSGTWTVKATQGSKTASKSVSISTQGQGASVKLSFWNGELYDSGNEFADTTGGWSAYSGTMTKAADSLTFSGSNIAAQTVNPVDVTSYSTMTIEVYAPSANLCVCGLTATRQPAYALSNPDIPYNVQFNRHTAKTTLTINISAASGLMYPTFMSYGGTSYLYKATLS